MFFRELSRDSFQSHSEPLLPLCLGAVLRLLLLLLNYASPESKRMNEGYLWSQMSQRVPEWTLSMYDAFAAQAVSQENDNNCADSGQS